MLTGLKYSDHASKTVAKDTGIPRDRQKRKKALLIGINYITLKKEHGRLLKGHDDVDIINKLLIQLYSYESKDITIMKDHDKTPGHLQPIKDNIIREVRNLVTDPIDRDEFFIYYAGHATQREERRQNTERDHQDEYLLPVDARNEKGEVVLDNAIIDDAVMDACTSGTILDLDHDECNEIIGWKSLYYRVVRSVLEVPPGVRSRFRTGIAEWLKDPIHICNRICNRKRSQMKANIICISACGDSQKLIELPDDKTLAGVYLQRVQEDNDKLRRSYDEEVKKYKKNMRRCLPERPPGADKPQITSIRPVRMGTILKL
ncbi:hypothetical protein D9756_006835 [Leucocoprinus leucothites]|uniref:Peptidase C14 caspase domain-containing protein n=1 Tax=Leucocoprinus leucothites TaxID=201217 RepID=A0A8H5G217_9AGAR|nr:hypothetical protein D9756_006835 [Leucoagaricus leucothites]